MPWPVRILISVLVLAVVAAVIVRRVDESDQQQRYLHWETCVLNSGGTPLNSASWPRNCGDMPQP